MRLPSNPPRIKEGQIWRKKDTGQLVQITGKTHEKYCTKKLSGGRKTHAFPRNTLLLFWELVDNKNCDDVPSSSR